MKVWWWLLAGVFAVGAAAQGQVPCALHGDTYTCDWNGLEQTLSQAQTVSVVGDRIERYTAVQLHRLVTELGKTAAKGDERGDLTFAVEDPPNHGIAYGPMDHPLAELCIYDNRLEGKNRLVWVETFRGQPDRPWQSTVHAVIAQFEARFGHH